jgi:hypothetical protein
MGFKGQKSRAVRLTPRCQEIVKRLAACTSIARAEKFTIERVLEEALLAMEEHLDSAGERPTSLHSIVGKCRFQVIEKQSRRLEAFMLANPPTVQPPGKWEAVNATGLDEFDLWVGPHPHVAGLSALYVGPTRAGAGTGVFAVSGDDAPDMLTHLLRVTGQGSLAAARAALARCVNEASSVYRIGPDGVPPDRVTARRFNFLEGSR